MNAMLPKVFATCAVIVALAAPAAATSSAVWGTAQATTPPSPSGTQPPEIIHVVSHELCSALRSRIGPAIGMILQNDQTIAKGPGLFTEYNKAVQTQSDDARSIALLRLSNLVGPIAENIIAIKNQLSDPRFFPPRPQSDGQAQSLALRQKLLTALGSQETSLDIINGFVETQNLADLQHRDEGLIRSLAQPDFGNQASPTPDPFVEPNQPGLAGIAPQEPGYVNPATIPGLTVGYNTTTRLRDALEYMRKETNTRENAAGAAVTQAVVACGGQNPGATPTP